MSHPVCAEELHEYRYSYTQKKGLNVSNLKNSILNSKQNQHPVFKSWRKLFAFHFSLMSSRNGSVAWCCAFVYVGVGVNECQSEDCFVCFGTKPTQRAGARDFPRDRKKTKKDKVPQQNKRGQLTEEGSQQERAVNSSQGKPTVGERRLLGTMDPGPSSCLSGWPTWEDESAFLVAVWEFRSNTRSW